MNQNAGQGTNQISGNTSEEKLEEIPTRVSEEDFAKESRRRKSKRVRLIKALILSAVMASLSVMAHLAPQAGEDWYFPLALGLSALCGLYSYVRLPDNKILSRVYTTLTALGIPAVAFILVESYNKGFWHVGAQLSYLTAEPPYKMIYLNLIFYYLFFLVLTFLFGKFSTGYNIAASLCMAFAIVNFYVVKFRGSPLVPWDLLSIRTAGNVAGNYDYVIYWHMLFSSFGFAFILLTSGKMKGKLRLPAVRFAGLAAAVLALVMMTGSIQRDDVKQFWGMDTTLFTPNVRYTKNGLVVAYLANLHLINIEKPQGYSKEAVKEIQKKIETDQTEYEQTSAQAQTESAQAQTESVQAQSESAQSQPETDTMAQETKKDNSSSASITSSGFDLQKAPNIIVIMDEAFSDLSVLGDFKTNEDYMPFFRSMMDKYTGGHLMVSVKGGNTANTEYEFLSGDTMAFLPEGSVVYQQYISNPIPTLASYLGSLGYQTTGMHPYLGSGWDRERVYPLLGFDSFLDINSFTGAKTIRKFVSDESAFDKIISEFENKEEGSRQFLFEVTMQNHSGYTANPATDNGFTNEITLSDAPYQDTDTIAAERYLTLIKKSDEAFEHLIDYFDQNVTEPTIIVAFGDHEPNDYVTQVIDNLVNYDPTTSIEEFQKSYQVPFFIWNNFGLKKDDSADLMSVNYLNAYVLKQAGLPLTDYQEYLLNLRKTLPVICAGTYIDADGTYHDWNKRSDDKTYGSLLDEYNILTYNHLTDVKNRVDSLFEDPSDGSVLDQITKQSEELSEVTGTSK